MSSIIRHNREISLLLQTSVKVHSTMCEVETYFPLDEVCIQVFLDLKQATQPRPCTPCGRERRVTGEVIVGW